VLSWQLLWSLRRHDTHVHAERRFQHCICMTRLFCASSLALHIHI
jgi:hypothetical protein